MRPSSVPLVAAITLAAACVALPAQATTSPHPASTATSVPLLTGGRVTVHTSGSGVTSYAISGADSLIQSYQDSTGDHFTVPMVAAHYLDRQLDSSLFDVSALARDGITDRIPVTVTFAAGVTPTPPPGVAFTSVTGTTASGYLASATTFGAALRRRASFDGLTSMRLAAPAAPPVARPHFPLTDLQINAVDMTGKPTDTTVFLVNTDAVSREQAFVPVAAGIGRVAVPAGHYYALAGFSDVDSAGNYTAFREVAVNDFTVAPAPAVNTVTIDERTATSATGVTTPTPATQDGALLHFVRFDAAGGGAPFTLISLGGPNPPLYVSPVPAAAVGKLHYVYQWDGEGSGYRYDLAFPSDKGIPADETFVARDSQLATVTQRFDVDPPGAGTGSFLNGSTDPLLGRFGLSELGTLTGRPMPAELTQYLGTADGGQWAQTMTTPNFGMEFDGDPVTYKAGRDYHVDWGHGPLAPGFGNHEGQMPYCFACTAGNTLGFGFNEANDSVTTHSSFIFAPVTSHLVLAWNGTKFVDQQGFVANTDLPAATGTLHAVLDTDLSGAPAFTHSTATHTDLTVQVGDSDPELPAGAGCAGVTPTTPCHVLPALALTYGLDSDMTGSSTSPVQVMSLAVSHLSYNDIGSHARITSETVSVSFDNGRTWCPASVFGFNGHYLAVWSNPLSAKGTTPSLRVTAADADGNSISQTISNAYTYAGSGS